MSGGKFFKSFALSMALASVLCAQTTNVIIPIFQTDGRTYTNARITSVGDVYATVLFDGGGKRVKLEDLPEPFRSKYYDPQKAGAGVAAEKQQADAKREADLQTRRLLEERYKAARFMVVSGKLIPTNNLITLSRKISQVIPGKGCLLAPQRSYSYMPNVNSLQAIGAYSGGGATRYGKHNEKPNEWDVSEVFLKIKTDGFTDGKYLHVKCARDGTITLPMADGSSKTVFQFIEATPYIPQP